MANRDRKHETPYSQTGIDIIAKLWPEGQEKPRNTVAIKTPDLKGGPEHFERKDPVVTRFTIG